MIRILSTISTKKVYFLSLLVIDVDVFVQLVFSPYFRDRNSNIYGEYSI